MNFGIAAGRGRVYRCRNFFGVQSNQRPLRSAQHHNGYFAASKILLVLDVLVSGKKNVEPGPLRFGQQVPVGKRVPSSSSCLCDGVADQVGR